MSTCAHLSPQFIVQSLQGKFVWKDECTKCYINQKAAEGVSLCLLCLNGGCDYHSQLHFKQSKHPLILNFKTVLKEKNELDPPPKKEITKVAIGKPGGMDFSDEEWELWTELRCLECNLVLDGSQYKGIIESLINATSAADKTAISAWELEIKPCAHVETMVQTSNQHLTPEKLAHCGECELSSNLWMCLFCGHLGCGRKNYDGSGGNGHAVAHFQATGHSCVVKQGTITPDGQGSNHCYACDEEISDPKLTEHLQTFGINVARLEKTEKSVAELTLFANLNLSLSSVIEEGRVLIPLFGPGYTGMQNLGNSCYMNSVLQALLSLDEFRDRYYEQGSKHLEECTKPATECFLCQMAKVASGVWSGKYSVKLEAKPTTDQIEQKSEVQYYQDGIRPYMFKALVGKGHPEFSSDKQQDASEYLKHLFSYIQKAEKVAHLDDITKPFNFKQGSKLVCTSCGGFKIREQDSSDLRLPIIKSDQKKVVVNPSTMKEEEVSVVEFTQLIQASNLEEVTAFCPKCNTNSLFLKTNYIKQWPKYLFSVVNRIAFENWVIKKNITEIAFASETLDLSVLKKPVTQPGEFELQDESVVSNEPQVNEDALNNLKMMGFGENRSKRALLANDNNVELAMNWLFEKTDDATLDAPLPKPKAQAPSVFVSEENVIGLQNMGFSEKQAKIALRKTDNNLERAIDYLFSHDNIEEEENEIPNLQASDVSMDVEDPSNVQYELYSVIVHLGSSYGCGHYVSYIKKDKEWVLFNDAKVAKSTEPALGKGSVYLFRKVKDE